VSKLYEKEISRYPVFGPLRWMRELPIMGVFPLVVAGGAGASSRQALGTAVFSGMIFATILLIFSVPAFYVLIQGSTEGLCKRLGAKRKASDHAAGITPPMWNLIRIKKFWINYKAKST